eukprot:318466-Pelagomonas_calceolata.AAC.4
MESSKHKFPFSKCQIACIICPETFLEMLGEASKNTQNHTSTMQTCSLETPGKILSLVNLTIHTTPHKADKPKPSSMQTPGEFSQQDKEPLSRSATSGEFLGHRDTAASGSLEVWDGCVWVYVYVCVCVCPTRQPLLAWNLPAHRNSQQTEPVCYRMAYLWHLPLHTPLAALHAIWNPSTTHHREWVCCLPAIMCVDECRQPWNPLCCGVNNEPIVGCSRNSTLAVPTMPSRMTRCQNPVIECALTSCCLPLLH